MIFHLLQTDTYFNDTFLGRGVGRFVTQRWSFRLSSWTVSTPNSPPRKLSPILSVETLDSGQFLMLMWEGSEGSLVLAGGRFRETSLLLESSVSTLVLQHQETLEFGSKMKVSLWL